MAWFTGLGANATQWLGNAQQAVGNQAGAQKSYNASAAIRDPNVVYQGSINPLNVLSDLGNGSQFRPAGGGGGGGQQQNATPNTPNSPYAGGGGGGGAASSYDPVALMQYDRGIQQGNESLGRVDNQLNTALSNIGNQVNSAYNSLLGQQAQMERDYGTNKNQQLEDYQGARENVATNTRNLLLNARRLLGNAGASGGSADRYAVSNAAQKEGSANNAVVQKTNARNLAALDTSYQDNKDEFGRSFGDLESQKQMSERQVQSQFENQRAEILNAIAELTGKKAIAQGRSYEQAIAETNPYTSRVSSILNNIDSLAANPAVIRQREVNLSRPDLAQYQWNRFDAPAMAQQDPSLSPALAPIAGQQPDDDQRRLI